jgi:hypothetical protein
MSDDDERVARAARRRATWTGRLLDRDDGIPPVAATADERLALVFELSARAWSLTGNPIPSYARADTPTRMIRPTRS